MKTFGLREYFTHNYQMLSYDRVRINLRGEKNLALVLTEISYDDSFYKFPYIVTRTNEEILNENIESLNWEDFATVPLLFWHCPLNLKSKEC